MLKDCDVLVHKEKNMILSFQPSFLWQAACNWTEPVPDCSVPLRAIVVWFVVTATVNRHEKPEIYLNHF